MNPFPSALQTESNVKEMTSRDLSQDLFSMTETLALNRAIDTGSVAAKTADGHIYHSHHSRCFHRGKLFPAIKPSLQLPRDRHWHSYSGVLFTAPKTAPGCAMTELLLK